MEELQDRLNADRTTARHRRPPPGPDAKPITDADRGRPPREHEHKAHWVPTTTPGTGVYHERCACGATRTVTYRGDGELSRVEVTGTPWSGGSSRDAS